MSVRMRHTRGHTRNRRSHHALKRVETVSCKNCSAASLPHRVCTNCGQYRGRQVIDLTAKLEKKQKKLKALGKDPSATGEGRSAQDGTLDPAQLSKK